MFLANPLPFCPARLGGGFQPEVLSLSCEIQVSTVSLNLEVFKMNSSLSLENGSEEKVYKA